jgi:hypothetical protein
MGKTEQVKQFAQEHPFAAFVGAYTACRIGEWAILKLVHKAGQAIKKMKKTAEEEEEVSIKSA